MVPTYEEDPESCGPIAEFTVLLEIAGLNATDLCANYRERGMFPEQVERWRQAYQDVNEKPELTLTEKKEIERLCA